MERIIKNYKQWLSARHKLSTCKTRIARINRISQHYDILNEYVIDKCSSLIDSITYTKFDLKNGLEPKTDIIIDGDYYTGLISLKQALCEFVEYLNTIGYSAKPIKSSSFFKGSFNDFKRYIGPKCRNEVNIFCKSERDKHQSICEYCGKKAELQSAHVTERPIMIKRILDDHYKKGNDLYEVDLDEFFTLFKNAHLPIEENIFFLCKECHNDLDNKKIITIADIKQKRGF